jgi:aspartyl-tRNA(Asn)/glutamyl-tRNA(Gln) amidotransferase subunit A
MNKKRRDNAAAGQVAARLRARAMRPVAQLSIDGECRSAMRSTPTLSESVQTETITQLAAAISSRQLSPVELTETLLARVERLNPALNAFNLMTPERALAEARAAETLIMAGRYLGPLHGIPYGVKDIFDVAGLPTTAGSRLLADNMARDDAWATRRLAASGMVALGKTITVEFARGIIGINNIQGTPHNPWHPVAHIPGGSSAGTAVAVAAGLVPMGLGSDTGGSVRAPAGLCGTVGLKTTVGRISRHGVFPISEYLDSVGPLARSVEDCALVYQALLGVDPRDPSTASVPMHDVLDGLKSGVKGLRIGVPENVFLEDLDADTEHAVDEARRVFDALGAHLRPIEIPQAAPAERLGAILSGAEACAVHKDRLKEQHIAQMDPVVGPRMRADRDLKALDYILALREARALRASLANTLRDVDVLLMPTTPRPALPVAEVAADLDTYNQHSRVYARNTRIGNILDLCGLSLPAGFNDKGLPIGLLLCAKPFDEATIMRAGYAFEAATQWHRRAPDLTWAGG